MDFACTVGIACILEFEGVGLGSNSIGMVMDPDNDHVCDGSITALAGKGLTNPSPTQSDEAYTNSEAQVGSVSEPLPWPLKVCWDQDTDDQAFLVNLGHLIFYGAEQIGDQRCDLGDICTIQVPGAGLADSTLQIANECAVEDEHDWSPSLAVVATSDDGSSNVATFTVTLPSNLARLSYYDICWRSNLKSKAGDDATRVTLNGRLSVVGPALMHQNCYLSQTCTLSMEGVGLKLGGKLKIRKGACDPAVIGSADAQIVGVESLVEWDNTAWSNDDPPQPFIWAPSNGSPPPPDEMEITIGTPTGGYVFIFFKIYSEADSKSKSKI